MLEKELKSLPSPIITGKGKLTRRGQKLYYYSSHAA
jgi:hypothetical protein